jgi:ATP/maltotriose-dependent transcriptional regulator MalT
LLAGISGSRSGKPSLSLSLVAEAQASPASQDHVLDDATAEAAPAWFDYYDRSRLAGFKGQVHIRLAQPETAHAVMEKAIGALDPDAAKQRACYLADQATVCVDEGEVDHACQLGIQPFSCSARSSTRPASSASATFAPSCGPGQIIRPWST